MKNSLFTLILTGITFVFIASYMPCRKARSKAPLLRHLTMRPLCAYTGLVQKNSCGLRNYGYVDVRLAKTTQGGQENAGQENGRRTGRNIFPPPIFLFRRPGPDQVYLISVSAFLTWTSTSSFDGRVL
jgi:hypothetical protein